MKVAQCVMHSIFARIVLWIGLARPINFIISSIFNVSLTVVNAIILIKRTLIISSAGVVQVIALIVPMQGSAQHVLMSTI
jgi:hypothetical protein